MELSERLPDRERYQIMGDFYSDSETTYDKAIEAYSNLLELYPDNLTAINNLGLIYSGIGEREKGAEYYEEAIHKGDRSVVAYTNLASAYGGIGRYDEAKQLLESYIETISDSVSIRGSLVDLYIRQGKLELALVEAEKAFLLDPSSLSSFLRKGLIYRYMGDPVKAEAEFQKARQNNEMIGKIAGGAYLAYLYSEQGRFSEAMSVTSQSFEMVKKAGLGYWITRYHLAFSKIHLQTGQPQKALNEAEQAFVIAANREDLENMRNALFQKGLALLGLDDVSEAEKTANQLKELIEEGMNKRIIRLYYQLKGKIELQKGNHSQAVDFSQQALALLGPGPLTIDAGYINTLALAYYQSGELNQALSEYERITSLTTGRLEWGDIYAKSFYMLGKIYQQQGDTAKAKENYEKFLTLWKDADPGLPEHADAHTRLTRLQDR
jgi:tetratricopeptide (TPR) repeat protein